MVATINTTDVALDVQKSNIWEEWGVISKIDTPNKIFHITNFWWFKDVIKSIIWKMDGDSASCMISDLKWMRQNCKADDYAEDIEKAA